MYLRSYVCRNILIDGVPQSVLYLVVCPEVMGQVLCRDENLKDETLELLLKNAPFQHDREMTKQNVAGYL